MKLTQAQRNVDKEFYEAHATTDVRAQEFLRKNAHTRINKDGQPILIFTPGGQELYNNPTVYAQTWKDYSTEYQAMLAVAPSKTLSQQQWEITKSTAETAAKGVGKGIANYPSDVANGLLNLPVQIIYPLIPNKEQENGIQKLFKPIEFIPVPFVYNNDVERDVGRQTQHIIDVGLVAGSAKKVLPKSESSKAVTPSSSPQPVKNNGIRGGAAKTNPIVQAEIEALQRIAKNPKGPNLSERAAKRAADAKVASQKAIDDLNAGNFPGKPIGGSGTPREMPVSSNSNIAAHKYIRDLFGGEMPVNKKYLDARCPGCWVAKTPDGTSVTFRPAGAASDKTLPTTASVDINNSAIRSNNVKSNGKEEHLKLKFPEAQKAMP